uniref:Uncharacterized protein n=1 Tax=Arundo donax TaxID=35708 RepID=A0A0A9AGR7_ARUDO
MPRGSPSVLPPTPSPIHFPPQREAMRLGQHAAAARQLLDAAAAREQKALTAQHRKGAAAAAARDGSSGEAAAANSVDAAPLPPSGASRSPKSSPSAPATLELHHGVMQPAVETRCLLRYHGKLFVFAFPCSKHYYCWSKQKDLLIQLDGFMHQDLLAYKFV